ncbi:hypothetical protein GUJ93_ZPchr0013g34742 [Zizania palustris]|uniref:Uncharacterized protein n=1 Tax=Zizania palustris TaxID=103762 RepID=A0A8J6BWN9_ZIZPA|nr:hypothetical protein GUJ93_ZPchr0013g34742 [Zizania palustris]
MDLSRKSKHEHAKQGRHLLLYGCLLFIALPPKTWPACAAPGEAVEARLLAPLSAEACVGVFFTPALRQNSSAEMSASLQRHARQTVGDEEKPEAGS